MTRHNLEDWFMNIHVGQGSAGSSFMFFDITHCPLAGRAGEKGKTA
jgi:hypothetical protein